MCCVATVLAMLNIAKVHAASRPAAMRRVLKQLLSMANTVQGAARATALSTTYRKCKNPTVVGSQQYVEGSSGFVGVFLVFGGYPRRHGLARGEIMSTALLYYRRQSWW